MINKTAIILGASGLVGAALLKVLLHHDAFSTIITIGRKTLDITHSKLVQRIVDFDNETSYKNAFEKVDIIFACVGTTQKKVSGNKEAYKKIDYDINVRAAQYGSRLGVAQFHIVSAIGANSKSSNFYIQLKGSIEDAIRQCNYNSIHIYQPALLIGKRNEQRKGEAIAQKMLPWFNWMFISALKKYHTITATEVARAMCNASLQQVSGVFTYDYKAMQQRQLPNT
jgi:uncharacterized protein YbjT (DUF2867 family)